MGSVVKTPAEVMRSSARHSKAQQGLTTTWILLKFAVVLS